jgi:hypothetical protein
MKIQERLDERFDYGFNDSFNSISGNAVDSGFNEWMYTYLIHYSLNPKN